MTEASAVRSITLEDRTHLEAVRLFLAQWRGALTALSIVTLGSMVAWPNAAEPSVQIAWCVFAFANYFCQGIASWKLERAASLTHALRRWMPVLLAGIASSAIAWGLVPWLVSGASVRELLFACLFDAMLLFCVANSPGTPAMLVSATVPLTLLTSSSLFRHGELFHVAVGHTILMGMIFLYGLRVERAVFATMRERLVARDLADELHRQQHRLVALEHERTLLLERQRLMRDMHDGIGSALTSSLVAVEHGEVRPQELAAMLRDCVDDLRLVIDSLEPSQHDLVALLASVRPRLERRLKLSGVGLQWEMQDLPALLWMGPSEALQVMRMVQEMLSNVVKHAGAHSVWMVARPLGEVIEIGIADDGCGFDMSSPVLGGRGLASLRQRALALGGSVAIESSPGRGANVRVHLPLIR